MSNDLISKSSLLSGIEELKQSPWFNRGKLEKTDTDVGYNRALQHVGYLERKEAVEIIVDMCIKKEPTIEAQPVKHGRWIEEHTNQIRWPPNEHESYNAQDTSLTERRCSNCKLWSVDFTSRIIMNFCPMCGARMDGDS